MKTIAFLFVVILFNSLTLRGQQVDAESIQIKDNLNHSYQYGSSPAELQKAFGKAVITKPKSKSEMSEMTGQFYFEYKYDGLEVSFESEDFGGKDLSNNSIHISSPKYRLFLNGIVYKVGDNIKDVIKHFPDAFKDREVGPDPNKQQMFIGIKNIDVNISIDYNKLGIINGIWIVYNES